MALPTTTIITQNVIHAYAEDGKLLFKYQPLQNLKIENISDGGIDIDDLRLSAKTANIDINKPIFIDTEVSYDDSINILINDYSNPLKIVNSRFYLIDSKSYKIADRKGNLDTNIYTEADFKIEAGLIKTARSIITLDFLGIKNGGNMPVGSYNFYFKLADADGNETDFVSESGKVVCHIGTINHPQSIRGGQNDEISDKIIKFRLNNLDLAYDYINIYYTRNSGDANTELLKTYKINDKFKIRGTSTEIAITGYEDHEEIDITEINTEYIIFDAAKTNANCQNITFAGNITKDYELFKTLEKYSLFITPQLSYDKTIGNLDHLYNEGFSVEEGYEYFNMNNVYYKLGYWDEDIYRFGIVYILDDYSLSPVFNIRGIQELTSTTTFWNEYTRDSELKYEEDFILEESLNGNRENVKGIFKIIGNNTGSDITFNGSNQIKPIGIKFNFNDNSSAGSIIKTDTNSGAPGLEDLTKGFFIVRQKRIPTILTQGVGIATSEKAYNPIVYGNYATGAIGYFSESFLKPHNSESEAQKPLLGSSFFEVADVRNNALLCPDASLKTAIYNNYFNSSEFVLKTARFASNTNQLYKSNNIFYLSNLSPIGVSTEVTSNLMIVEPGIELINNMSTKFCSQGGIPTAPELHIDPKWGELFDVPDTLLPDYTTVEEIQEALSYDCTKVRGEFNTYIGSTNSNLVFGQHYNIFQKGYDFKTNWKEYFRLRYNDSSPFMPISDRIAWSSITGNSTPTQYRGDCYINTYSHRMLWNFIDPDLPTNTKIVDKYTWYKNYRVKSLQPTILNPKWKTGDTLADLIETAPSYKKILDIFTYKNLLENSYAGEADDVVAMGLILPDGKKFKKYSEANGTFGSSKLNRPDINAVPLGHWVTFKICSNTNTALRDLDFSRPGEEALHKMKRGFYPLQSADPTVKLPESAVVNSGLNKALGDKYYFEIPDMPFIKTNFSNRIHYSEVLQESAFKNGNRVFRRQNYQDYTREYGEIVKLIEWYGKLIAVMEHGVIMIPVNERAMMKNEQGEDIYINTENVLPKNPRVLSNTYGSIWEDTIIKTPRYIYGLDTIGKKVWRTNGENFELISDMKIQKFLNDNIKLSVTDTNRTPGTFSIKAHYNAFKFDIMFVFTYNGVKWNLCWNELLNKWTTQYSWFPEFSENINNIFYTFANKDIYTNGNVLYKHGFAGNIEELGNIYPTKWYDIQNEFEFEFVVIGVQGVQKIFDNLKIISNLTAPKAFYYEIVGESFDWNYQKEVILKLNNFTLATVEGIAMPVRGLETDLQYLENRYKAYLIGTPTVKKIPFISNIQLDILSDIYKDLTIEQHNKTKENLIISYQKGLDIKTNGRIKGNMQYVEDSWDVQIQPISFKWAYVFGGNILYSNNAEMKIRDKYIKIRVKYNGENYAIINAIKTFFTISYA